MTTAEIERLLSHEGFLRRLAGRLVADPAAQDDLVQETWLAALSRSEDARSRERGWLAAVARNAARMRWRSERRRRRREEAAARPERTPGPEDVRERERARRTVVEAVLRLGEPYRSVVLLRYYEAMAPREVAARLDIPVETVRTQTRRAVERLRADLDRREGGGSWRLALAPLVPLPGHASHGPLFPLGSPLLMSLKARATWALTLLLLAVGGGTWWVLSDEGPAREPRTTPAAAVPTPSPMPDSDAGGEAPRLAGAAGERPAPLASAGTGPDLFRKSRPRGVLRGIVQSGRTHEPVAGAEVLAVMERGEAPDGLTIRERPEESASARTDAEGRFVLEDLPVGAYRVSVEHPEEGTSEAVGLAAASPPWVRLYVLPPDPAVVRVRVVDAERRPLADARVEIALEGGAWARETFTDEEGLARFPGLPSPPGQHLGWVTARTPSALGRAEVRLDTRYARGELPPLEVVLASSGAIVGRLRAPTGVRVVGAEVQAWSLTGGQGAWVNGLLQGTVAAADDGTFRLEALPAGPCVLLVSSTSGLRMDLSPKSTGVHTDWEPLHVQVEAGRTTEVEVPLVAGGTIRGQVRRVGGGPVGGARVEVHLPQGPGDHAERYTRGGAPVWRLDSLTPDARRSPLTFRVLRTDAKGRYEASGLLPGGYRVRAVPEDGLSFDAKHSVLVEDGKVSEVEHVVEPAGTLELAARPFDSLGLWREGQPGLFAALITQQGGLGAVTVPGLGAGRWVIGNLHSDERIPPVPLASFEVRAGEITYVDVSDAGDTRLRLRVLAGGRPLAGIPVVTGAHGWATPMTDESGRASVALTTYGPVADLEVRLHPDGPRGLPLATRIPIRDGETDVVLPSGSLAVRVLDAGGRTVPGASVLLRAPPAAQGATWWPAVTEHARRSDAGGIAAWRHVPPGEYGIEVRLPARGGRASGAVTVAEEPVSVDVRVPEPGAVRIRVWGTDGRPAANVAVSLSALPKEREAEGWKRALVLTENGWRTDAEGTLLVQGVPEGLARAGAWILDAAGWSARENAEAEVRVLPGQTVDAELRLRPVPR